MVIILFDFFLVSSLVFLLFILALLTAAVESFTFCGVIFP